MLSFFIRHNVENAVIIIDEPEMHLHPELSRLLIRQMQSVKPSNQIWVATHNPEIIDEAGQDKTIYVDRDRITRKSIVTLGSDEDQRIVQLRNLFGFSGYLGVGKCLVFLEGEDHSSDRRMFSKFFPQHGGQIRFVPSGSSDNTTRINNAVLSILEENIGWMKYYLIRDRDYLTDEMAKTLTARGKGRIKILDRYHIENYLIDFNVISRILDDIYGIKLSCEEISAQMIETAASLSAEFIKGMAAFQLNLMYWGEDFSLGRDFEAEAAFDRHGNENVGLLSSMKQKFMHRAETVNSEIGTRTSETEISKLLDETKNSIRECIFDGSNSWSHYLPGRKILDLYSKNLGIKDTIAFRNNIIRDIASRKQDIPEELSYVVEVISSDQLFQH